MYSELAKAVRFLAVDAVEQAQSGHPGMPLGMADIATVLWKKFLRHSPQNPYWFNRDRFVLSNGHGSMLLYALLHLTGYKLTITDLQQFRQLHSKTPGHPEYRETIGVETTTGPLGQGLGNAVGMALAEKTLAQEFNTIDMPLVNHYTYTFIGDGCLMEGISHEVCSLAGTLGLGKLIVFYDDNGISIDGKVTTWFSENVAARFNAYDWQVIGPIDGHDASAIEQAILEAQAEPHKPSMIICKTTIGYGSLVAGSEKSHGAPLGASSITHLRETLAWPYPPFVIPEEIYQAWSQIATGDAEEAEWLSLCAQYQQQDKTRYETFLRRINGDLPDNFASFFQTLFEKAKQDPKALATRKASQWCLQELGAYLPELIGGSADLTSSNNTDWSGSIALHKENFKANYCHYGVREFGMCAIMNGLALHGGFIPYGGTFLVFIDYARAAMRLAALMQLRVIYILTHDSIGLGEDGPTHQPIEHAAILRLTPHLHLWRPADLLETVVAWQSALQYRSGPTALALSRQNLPALSAERQIHAIAKGAYIVQDCEKQPELLVLATGSEVHLALEALHHPLLKDKAIRLISMPCCELFLQQEAAYQEAILPSTCLSRVLIEASHQDYWYRFAGFDGKIIGLNDFGLSGKAEDIFDHFGFTTEKIVNVIVEYLATRKAIQF